MPAAPFSIIDNTDLSSLFEPVRPNTSPFDTLRRITDEHFSPLADGLN